MLCKQTFFPSTKVMSWIRSTGSLAPYSILSIGRTQKEIFSCSSFATLAPTPFLKYRILSFKKGVGFVCIFRFGKWLLFYRFGGVPLAAPMEIAPKNYAAVVAGRPKTDRRVCNIFDFVKAEKSRYCLVGRFLRGHPLLLVVREFARKNWRTKGDLSITLLDPRHVFLKWSM